MKSEKLPPVQIKADRDGFLLVPDSVATLQIIVEFVEGRLKESRDFFHGSKMALDLRDRPFRVEEIEALREVLKKTADVTLVEVRLGNSMGFLLEWASRQLGVTVRESKDMAADDRPHPVIVQTTCRSGARIESPADCIILGDVNPGAEVLAAGDIIIFGNLRGMAHAGALGDRSARIWALSIEPNQIRIADTAAVPPRNDKPAPKRYEVAEIREGRIQVLTIKN